jgi:hypothetical protein
LFPFSPLPKKGYKRYFDGLKDFLASQPSIAGKVELVALPDRGLTGNFIVTVLGTGQVLHSNKGTGLGKAQTMKERNDILVQIQELLE